MDEKIKAARVKLGGFIKERREVLGMSQEVLGRACGVTANTINGVETGRFAMDVDLMLVIFRELSIKPYYSFLLPEADTVDCSLLGEGDPDKYRGFYVSENILLYPDQLAIIKLTYPRLFVRFNYGDSYFSNYEGWKNNLTDLQWLDPGDRPLSEEKVEYHLTDCWNFLALHER